MNTLSIVAITLFSYWLIGFILFIATNENKNVILLWGMGLVYILAYVIFYPVRAMNAYSAMEFQYKALGISRFQYLLGKRPKTRGRYKNV